MKYVSCVCVWLGLGWEMLGLRGLGLGFTNPGGTWGKWDMCLCFNCGGTGGGVGGRCYVCVCCESGLFVLMAGPGICILC